MLLTDGDGHPLTHTLGTDGAMRLDDPRYKAFRLVPGTVPGGRLLRIEVGRYEVPLVLAPDSVRLGIPGGTATTETPLLASPPARWELLLSSRAYIWNRTIPLLKGKLLTGAGPGAFPAAFPQRDFAGKLNAYNGFNTLVDKPHDQFLQIVHASGGVSLLALLALWGLFLARRTPGPFGPALTGAVAAYLVSALVNDSVVAVAPTFWALLGLGLGLQRSAIPIPPKPAVSRTSVFTFPSRRQVPLSE